MNRDKGIMLLWDNACDINNYYLNSLIVNSNQTIVPLGFSIETFHLKKQVMKKILFILFVCFCTMLLRANAQMRDTTSPMNRQHVRADPAFHKSKKQKITVLILFSGRWFLATQHMPRTNGINHASIK
jgi:hypothetical protein